MHAKTVIFSSQNILAFTSLNVFRTTGSILTSYTAKRFISSVLINDDKRICFECILSDKPSKTAFHM